MHNKLRQLRLDSGLSLTQFSQLTEISISYLSELEQGKKPISLRILKLYAEQLNFPLYSLFIDNSTTEELVICHSAVRKFGKHAQRGVMQEECAELIQAISKLNRYGETQQTLENFISELVDVEIVLTQMKLTVHEGIYNTMKQIKLDKLKNYLTNS